MTKQLLILTAAAAAFAQNPGWIAAPGGGFISLRTDRLDGQSGPVLDKPFSATEVRHTTQVLADGTHVDHSDSSVFYRDVQGRMRVEGDYNVLIYDPAADLVYHLWPRTKQYEKAMAADQGATVAIAVAGSRTSFSSVSGRPSPRSQPASTTEDLATQSLNGVSARGSRITTVIPKGTFGNDRDVTISTERWYSDDLKALIKSSTSDPRFGTSTYELTNIVQGPPDPVLFTVPADYTPR